MGEVSLDVAHGAPDHFEIDQGEAMSVMDRQKVRNERVKSLRRSEGESEGEVVGGTCTTPASACGQHDELEDELTHLVYPLRCHDPLSMLPGRPPDADEPYAMEREVVDAERRCAEAHEAVDTANECDQHNVDMREGADCRGGMQGDVLTVFESPRHPQRVREPPISCDVPEGHAGRMLSAWHVAAAAADPDEPPELEGEFLDCGRQLVDLEHARMARNAEETGQYGDLLLSDIPVGFPPALG